MSEYTLENVMCPECGHRAGKHLAEDADSYAGCCEDNCTDGNGGPYFHCKCEKSMESILLHHLNAVANERDAAISVLAELVEMVEPPPAPNCQCLNAPPCSDCVEYSGLRESLARADELLKASKA